MEALASVRVTSMHLQIKWCVPADSISAGKAIIISSAVLSVSGAISPSAAACPDFRPSAYSRAKPAEPCTSPVEYIPDGKLFTRNICRRVSHSGRFRPIESKFI